MLVVFFFLGTRHASRCWYWGRDGRDDIVGDTGAFDFGLDDWVAVGEAD